jgi:hypothetical protein
MRRGIGRSHCGPAQLAGIAPSTVLIWEHQREGPRNTRQAEFESFLQAELFKLLQK